MIFLLLFEKENLRNNLSHLVVKKDSTPSLFYSLSRFRPFPRMIAEIVGIAQCSRNFPEAGKKEKWTIPGDHNERSLCVFKMALPGQGVAYC